LIFTHYINITQWLLYITLITLPHIDLTFKLYSITYSFTLISFIIHTLRILIDYYTLTLHYYTYYYHITLLHITLLFINILHITTITAITIYSPPHWFRLTPDLRTQSGIRIRMIRTIIYNLECENRLTTIYDRWGGGGGGGGFSISPIIHITE